LIKFHSIVDMIGIMDVFFIIYKYMAIYGVCVNVWTHIEFLCITC